MEFPISGIEVFPLVPPLVAFVISAITSTGGVSGAFLLLPFQVSVLGFTSPAVSPTNMVYNLVAIPGGVYSYIREGRMAWPLFWVITIGTLPGIFAGAMIRVTWLPDPGPFKFFVGWVLLYIGGRLLVEMARRGPEKGPRAAWTAAGPPGASAVRTRRVSALAIEYEFQGKIFTFNPCTLLALSAAVGVVGGTYGIGGGAIVAPFLVAIFRLPVYTIAGATLFSSFVTSIAGVTFYTLIAPAYAGTGLAVAPDWLLGVLFGIGGLAGTYCGARAQKYMPEKAVKTILALCITALAARYILGHLL
jgi:uncharacterized membrane protein YfcA